MKKLIFVLITTTLLVGCGLNQEESYKKKVECISYEKAIRAQLMWQDRYWFVEEWKWAGDIHLGKIFYSKARNSCLYTSDYSTVAGNTLRIYDYFTREMVHEKLCVEHKWAPEVFLDCLEAFNKKLAELGG